MRELRNQQTFCQQKNKNILMSPHERMQRKAMRSFNFIQFKRISKKTEPKK